MSTDTVRVVTRGSRLALAQCGRLVDQLRCANPRVVFEIITVKTTGDTVTDRPLASFRGTGVFVKELQRTLLSGDADLAVHSLKDVPSDQPEGLSLVAFPPRALPWDLLVTRDGSSLAALSHGAVVGTGSPRRLAQLKAVRPDFVFRDLRGNVDTRLKKLEEGLYDAIVLAAAGMDRLGTAYPRTAVLPLDICIPAVGQGILALECRADDRRAGAVAARVDDNAARIAAGAERAFLTAVGGGCSMPLAAYARPSGENIEIVAMIGDPDGGRIVRREVQGPVRDALPLAVALAETIKEQCIKEGIALE